MELFNIRSCNCILLAHEEGSFKRIFKHHFEDGCENGISVTYFVSFSFLLLMPILFSLYKNYSA